MGSGCSCAHGCVYVISKPAVADKVASQPSHAKQLVQTDSRQGATSIAFGTSRLVSWAWMSGAHQHRKLAGDGHYAELVRKSAKEDAVPAQVLRSIAADVPRTMFAGQHLTAAETESLERILRCIALWDAELAYCQGLNFIASFALRSATERAASNEVGASSGSQPSQLSGSVEEDTFWLLCCVLRDYGARELFLDRTPLLKLYSFCLARLIEQQLPELQRILSGLEEVLGYKWFGTMFVTLLPPNVVAQIWNLMLAEGLPALIASAMGLCLLLTDVLRKGQQEGEEAMAVIGELQRQLPSDISPLLPLGWTSPSRNTEEAHAEAGKRLLEAAGKFKCGTEELEALLAQWRIERPGESADLSDVFSFRQAIDHIGSSPPKVAL
eukprot:TRINITY_DN89257_c0_g1_i1.p1 TRINITY_DN89257_c0_g1~~TRINITY_DN89257_c0_g1_i1.p1  ORF type:complete len:383 (-),score=62.16 TRINITY_DN89257_c0_g1_i1:263-1411(-)